MVPGVGIMRVIGSQTQSLHMVNQHDPSTSRIVPSAKNAMQSPNNLTNITLLPSTGITDPYVEQRIVTTE